jgi:molybdopterin molybdotransferase
MKQLLTLTPREDALTRLLEALPQGHLPAETISTREALGRVLAHDVTAPHSLPHFPRSTVDGYAVRAADTVGAGESLPAYLRVVGELAMGRPPAVEIGPGQAAIIHTGSVLPPGADAIVMIERTQEAGPDEVEVLKPVASGENVIPVGEDVRQGEVVMHAGRVLRAQGLGGLMALGITEVSVVRRPRIAILSTGDELVPPDVMPGMNQVRDINSTTIAALVEANGGVPLPLGIIRDNADALYAAAKAAHREADVVIITAGSSVSVRDMTATIINRLGEPGVLIHGVTIKPGKPTILGICEGKPVYGLPGNPVSAMNSARLFVAPVLWRLQGAASPRPCTLRAQLAENAPAGPGRETFVSVQLEERDGELWAVPIFGESNLIFTLVRGEGVVQIPLGATGLPKGAEVEVVLLK